MHQDDCLPNFYVHCMSSLSTIYHYASLALQRNFIGLFSIAIKLEGISSLTYNNYVLHNYMAYIHLVLVTFHFWRNEIVDWY